MTYVEFCCAEDIYTELIYGDSNFLSRILLSRGTLRRVHTDLIFDQLPHAESSSVEWSYGELSYVELNYAELTYAVLSNAEMSYAGLSYTKLSCADLN